jgi:hypothetical protein
VAGEVWHVNKGGAFNTPPDNAAANSRGAIPDDRRFWYTRFRCARAAGPAR